MDSVTLIFVHGMWHTPECFSKIIPKLEMAGLKCIAPQMLFTSQDPPVQSNKPDIEMLQQLIRAELSAGRDVVMVAHSLGGLHSASALQGLVNDTGNPDEPGKSGKVKGLVMMSAVMVPSGRSLNDARGGAYAPYVTDDPVTGWIHLNCDPIPLFYQDLPPEEAGYWVSRLTKQSRYTALSEEGIYAGYLDVPVWYLLCTVDQTVPFDIQQGIVKAAKAAGAQVTTRSLECGHSPMLVYPDETVEFIQEALNALV